MSPTPFNVPLNAKMVAKHGTTFVYALKDGRIAFVDHARNRMFLDGSRDVGSGTYGSGHNSAWADARLTAVAAKGGSASFAMTKALKPKQSRSPVAEPEPPGEDLPDEPFARMLPFIPKKFLDWAASYEVGDPLPPMMPGYGSVTLCEKNINDDSYSQDEYGVEQVVDAGLRALGVPEVNPALAFAPEPETKSMPPFEQKGILGREIRDMARNVMDSILRARGLWKDELNKIRCGSGPNANRFTDIFGTGCDVPGANILGNVVGAVRGVVDVPGPVDEIVGRAEGAREKLADAADGPDVPGSRPSLAERLRARLTGVRGGHTPHYEADRPNDLDPAAGMIDTIAARRSERFGFIGLRSLVSRNKQREREKRATERAKKIRRMFEEFIGSDEHKRWAADFELRTGRAPHPGEQIDQFVRHHGWTGSFKDAQGNALVDAYRRPIGSFMGGADTAVVNGAIRDDLTLFEAIVEQIVHAPENNGLMFDQKSDRAKERLRKEAAERLAEYMLMTAEGMLNTGGPAKLPDGTDNPEHKKRFAEVIPTFIRIKHWRDRSAAPDSNLKDASVITAVTGFFGDEGFVERPHLDDMTPFPYNPGSEPLDHLNGATPLWLLNSGDSVPFMATITIDPKWFADSQYQKDSLTGFSFDHLGMDPKREAFLMHTADHELSHIDDFAQRLGNKLGYFSSSAGYGEAEWKERLSRQRFDPASGSWIDRIDLGRDYVRLAEKDASGEIFGYRPVSYLGQQIEKLQQVLDPAALKTPYEKKKALWEFYMFNIQFDSQVESAFARWLANEAPRHGGQRLSKEAQAKMLEQIREELAIRGYTDEHGIPLLNFWRDFLDTPLGRWNKDEGRFEFPYNPLTGRRDTTPFNLIDGRLGPLSGATNQPVHPRSLVPGDVDTPFGQARLDNLVSNMLHGFIGGTYAGENDYEFAAELRSHLNKQGALAEIREFLADTERNSHNLDENTFMTLVARYVGQDEVYRLYGKKAPRGSNQGFGPFDGGAPGGGGGAPGGGGGAAIGRPPILLGPGTGPTIPTVPRADDPDVPGDVPPAPDAGRLRGSGVGPDVPGTGRRGREVVIEDVDGPKPEAPPRVTGTGVKRPVRPKTDDDLVEPTVRPETDADRVSPERRRADADKGRRMRELFDDDESAVPVATVPEAPESSEIPPGRERDRLRVTEIRTQELPRSRARVSEAETRHDDALRRARRTGSDPDRGGDGDPAAWAEYRVAYEDLNEADAENNQLSRESRELEERISKNEPPALGPEGAHQGSSTEMEERNMQFLDGSSADGQIRMTNKETGETVYVNRRNREAMADLKLHGFVPTDRASKRKPTAARPDDPDNPPRTAAAHLMLVDTKNSDLARVIIYDPKNGDLRVTYKDGRVVTFKNVWYERARKAGEDDRPDDLIEALEREQFQQISRPIGRLGDDGQGSGRQTGPRKRNRGGGRFHRMVNDSGDEILISVDDGDGYYDARRDGYRDRGMVGSADAGMLGRLSRRDQEIIRRESNRFNEEWRRQDRPGIGAEAGMASGDRSRTVGRVTRGTLRDRALAKLLDKILKRTGADEETKEKVKIGLGLATAFSAGGPAGAATYVAVEAARRGGRDLAEFTIDELLKRGKIDAEQARRAMAAVDRIAPDGLPDGARRQLGRAFSEAADLFNERINTPENRRRLAEMGEGIVDSARGRAREVGRRIGRPRGDVAEAGMGLPQGEVPNEKLPARNNWFTSNKIKKGGALKAQEILNFDRLRRKNRDEQASVLGVTREIIDKMHEPDASIEPFDADRLVVSALGANPMEIFGDAWLMADKTPERRKLQNIGKLDDRDNRILEIRANGGKVQDIADELKISKQRASFLLDRALRRNERDLDSQAEAGMAGARREGGSTYGRLVRKHADVVSTKRDEIDEARRSLANAARGARHRRGQTPAEKNAIYEERAAIYWAMNKLFSGNFRLDRENAGVRDVRIRVRNSPSHVTANRNGGLRIEIPMELTSPDGKVLYGHATNFVNVNSHGDIEIEHADIVVYDKYRGMGLASEFNARNENIYKAIGARSITLKGTSSSLPDSDNPEMPDMVFQTGATHWARNGFTWQDEKSKQNFIGVIDRALRDRPEIFSTEERQRIGSLYRKGGDGKFETRATAKDLVNFESADRLFAEDGAVVHYRRDLVPPGRRDKPGLGPEAGMAEAGRAMSRADAVNAEMERRNGPALKRDTDADAKTVMAMPPPFSARDSQTLTQVTADSDALTASIAQQRKALVEKYAPGRHGEPVESYADELMDNMGVARESGWSWPGGTPMTFSEQLDQAMDYFLRTAEQDGKEDQIPDPNDSFEDRELNHMKGAAKLAALELAQTEEGRREVREAMAQGFLDVLAGAEPALEKDPSLRRATTIRMHINDKSDWRKFAGYAQTELGRDGKVKLVVTLNPTILAFDSSLFFGSDEGPLSKGQGLSEVIRFAGADDYHFGLGVHEYAHLEHYKTWYSSLGLQVGRDAPPLSEQLDGRLDKSLMGTEIARRHNFPQDATWDDVRETFAKTNPLRDPANLETHASVIEATPEEWVDVQESQKTHDISWVHLAPPLDHSMNEIVERLYRLNQVRDQRRKEGGGFTGESMRERLMETMGTAGSTRKNVSADNFSRMVDALQTYDDTAANPFAGTFPENLTEDQKRSIIARNKMPEKVGSFFLALDDNSDETKFLGPEDVRKIVTEVLEGQTPEEFLATHKRIMDQVLGYDSKFASTLGVPTDDVMRVLGRSSKYGQTNIFEAVAEARVLTLYAERFREALSVKQLQQVEEMMEMLERIIPDGSVGVAVRNLTPEAKEHFARLERMLGKVPALKLDWDSVRQ